MNDLFKDTPYSETIGSFIRNGNYPLEANYIFPTEEALKEFYSDEVNATTIHKGLLKIVENDGTGKQALYWVTKNQTSDELEFTKLISGTNIDSISRYEGNQLIIKEDGIYYQTNIEYQDGIITFKVNGNIVKQLKLDEIDWYEG